MINESVYRNMSPRGDTIPPLAPARDFEFTLKLRVACHRALWQAAARRCIDDMQASDDELIELIGPVDDSSIEDCLMVLTLPKAIAGCTMISVSVDRDDEAAAR